MAARGTMVLPPGWVTDWIVVDRLARQLADAPADVAGVVAPGGPLPPGSSFRTHAEHLALRPRRAGPIQQGSTPVGAAMTREGASFEATATGVVVDGLVMLDHATHAHDPAAPPPALAPAGSGCRSPFPVRPVVVFLGVADAELDHRILPMVNLLVGADVEARLAVSAIPAGDHLTAPCDPSSASLGALLPDILVPLDDEAVALAQRWAEATGFVPLVELTEDIASFEIVTTRDGSAAKGIAARVNPATAIDELALLFNRLASGPRPITRATPEVAVHLT